MSGIDRPSQRRRTIAKAVLAAGLLRAAPPARSSIVDTIQVGPRRAVSTIARAARIARQGMVVEIDAGDYAGDVAVWERPGVTIRGVGGRPRLLGGKVAEDKAVWVIRAPDVVVENIEFRDAVDSYGDGTGIRFEAGSLVVRNCLFAANQMGLMTANKPDMSLTVVGCEFTGNRSEARISHQLYVGRIGRFEIRESYFHGGFKGHLLKSRARESIVAYNRLTDESDGESSYELEFPDGGLAFAIGNLIEQSRKTQNDTIASYGAESLRWPRNELFLVHNTVVNHLAVGGRFLYVHPRTDAVWLVNNLLVGPGQPGSPEFTAARGNHRADDSDFADPGQLDYRLRRGSRLVGQAVKLSIAGAPDLDPVAEYRHPLGSSPLPPEESGQPGAFQRTAE